MAEVFLKRSMKGVPFAFGLDLALDLDSAGMVKIISDNVEGHITGLEYSLVTGFVYGQCKRKGGG